MCQSVARLSIRRPDFHHRSVHVSIVCTKWHWVRFCPEYVGFYLSASFTQCSILIFNNMLLTEEGQNWEKLKNQWSFGKRTSLVRNKISLFFILLNNDICMYICMYVHIYVYIYVCMYVCTYVCMNVCMYVRTYLCAHVRRNVCKYVFVYMCIYIYTYIYIYIYTVTHRPTS